MLYPRPQFVRLGRAFLLFICLLLCAMLAPRPFPSVFGAPAAPQAAPKRKLAYVFGGGVSSSDIFVVNEDGTEPLRLTFNGVDDQTPTWSPDGSQIAFASNRGGAFNIFRMNPDGTGQVPLTNMTQGLNYDPSWSPDGQKIAFLSNRAGERRGEIWVMGADGINPQRLTENVVLATDSNGPFYSNDREPAWSPDGTRIAFSSNRDGIANQEIYVMNADGSNPVRLTNSAQDDSDPTWSPDGTRIAFSSKRDGGRPEIYVMNADGSGQTNLTNTIDANEAEPSWSQDGASIAYVRISGQFNGAFAIYQMGADGSNPTLVVQNSPVDSWMPAWQTLGGPKPPDPPQAPPYRLTGRVTDNSSGPNQTGAPGVVMQLSGAQSAVTQTNANGEYVFEGLAPNSTFTVTPKTTSYGYSPTSQTFATGAPENSVGSGGTITRNFSASPIFLQFNSAGDSASESVTQRGFTVERVGFITGESTVDYAITGGTATPGTDYVSVSGTLRFAPGQSTLGVAIPVIDDSTVEPNETIIVKLTNPTGAFLGRDTFVLTIQDNDVAPNPIDGTNFFVTQHYRDFLNREPDAAGLQFWTNEIESCGADAQCREAKRVNVSAAFFLSIEFQQTGYLVERMYKAAYGDIIDPSTNSTNLPVPILRRAEFLADAPLISAGVVVNQGNWETTLENNKVAYAQTFVQRQRFTDIYGALGPAAFVDKLNANAGGVLSAAERQGLIDELTADNGVAKRASVLRRVAENAELDRRERNRAYVLMEYFGYLRRNPDDAPEAGRNYAGWNFWLLKLNQFNGDAVAAEMVKAFISSDEYRRRFVQ